MEKLLAKKYYLMWALLFSQLSIIYPTFANSEIADYNLDELPSLSFEDLMATDIQVTSAMKRLQNMSETAASIYVLSNKEIMQSGVTTVAQALRLIPGMQVRQIDNNQWAITTRSTAGRYSSKLLVMIDGQSIYSPGFAGVYWEALSMPLYDIERIEVIRGQGGLLWGSNATNGVVNIISKHSIDTTGVLAQVETGSQLDNSASFRVGGDLAKHSSFRVFGGVEHTDKSNSGNHDISPNDNGKKSNIGGRVDLNINEGLSLLVQTQYTHIDMGQNLQVADLNTHQRIYVEDEHEREHLELMARLEHRISDVSNQMLQASVSVQQGEQLFYNDDFVITDIDYQMNTIFNDTQVDWGVNYRYNDISVQDTDYIYSLANVNSYQHVGGFIQAQFNLIPEKVKLIVGNRSENNSFTGWEHQPMARILWTPLAKHTVWGAVSQGVRIPSLIEYDGIARGSSQYGIKTVITGSADIDAEKSIFQELGYRYGAHAWSVDVAAFHTKARNVLVVEKTVNPTYTLINVDFVSDAELTTYGGEVTIKWQPYQKLTTELGYSFTSYQYDLPAGSSSAIGHDSYMRQLMAKASFAVTAEHSLYSIFRYENSDAYDTGDYGTLDLSWHWQVLPSTGVSFTGNNLFYGKHLEYNNSSESYTVATYIEPSFVAKLTVEF